MIIGKATLYNCDCMEYMRGLPDKAFDLAIVDPPYGIGADNHAGPEKHGWRQWPKKEWDKSIPEKLYFSELFRVSKNQIIWGGNYFVLPPTRCLIVWDKGQRDFSLADGEIAWSSFDKNLRIWTYSRAQANLETKIHPTQKPVKLYEWLLTNYAKPGQRILDTHLGSMSSVIACLNMGFEIVGCELDADYFKAGCERVQQSQAQLRMFA
ncbi:MAG TPA: DNA methyltransferase [Candidatus Paceibacterota bacterium]